MSVERRPAYPVTDRAKSLIPYSQALDSWLDDLRRLGRDDEYTRNMGRLVRKIAEGCGWTSLASIRSDRVGEWLSDIRQNGLTDQKGVRKKQLPSDRTVIKVRSESARAFLNWCIGRRPPYLEENPLAGIKKARKFKRVRLRRAVSEVELGRLVKVSDRWCSVYRVAGPHGAEEGRIASAPMAGLPARGRQALDTAQGGGDQGAEGRPYPPGRGCLRRIEEDATPRPGAAGPVCPSLPSLKQFKRDLKAAGIPYRDDQGRQFDFHALRYCFCTMLAVRNVPIRTAMELMRHRDMRLTVQIYTDCGQLDLEGAVGSLPVLTADSDAEHLFQAGNTNF